MAAIKDPCVLVDASFIGYRAMHSIGHLETEDIPTGVMFGFFHQLRSICSSTFVGSNRVCIFFDSKKSHREKVYPPYKRKRRKDRSDEDKKKISLMWDQMEILRKAMPAMGFSVYRQTGLESDDLIAMAAQSLKGPDKKGVIITSDQDLFQCITNAVHWFDPQREAYFAPWRFKTAKGISPGRWGEVKALAGCSSDNVQGIHRVGEETAIKYILGTLPKHHETFKRIESEEGIEVEIRNRALVMLPHAKTKPVKLVKPKYHPKEFFAFCRRYGITSFLQSENKRKWRRFFEGVIVLKTRKRGEKNDG